MSNDRRCADCRFGLQFTDRDGTGVCRRYPPTEKGSHAYGGYRAIWPVVSHHDWCGEFLPHPEEARVGEQSAEVPPLNPNIEGQQR